MLGGKNNDASFTPAYVPNVYNSVLNSDGSLTIKENHELPEQVVERWRDRMNTQPDEVTSGPVEGGKLRTKKRRYKKRNIRSKRRKSKVSKRIRIKKRNSTLKKY